MNTTNKTAVITGVTGQDGAYLTELLLEKGYTRLRHLPPHQLGQLLALEELGVASHPNLEAG